MKTLGWTVWFKDLADKVQTRGFQTEEAANRFVASYGIEDALVMPVVDAEIVEATGGA